MAVSLFLIFYTVADLEMTQINILGNCDDRKPRDYRSCTCIDIYVCFLALLYSLQRS